MKIQQMAFMLLAVTLFFVMIGLVVLVFVFSGVRESASVQEENNAVLLATRLANSPEFSCGNSYGTREANCVDGEKFMVLKSQGRYEGFWGVDNIAVYKLGEGDTECRLDNFPDCDFIKLQDEEFSTLGMAKNFVSLCYKEEFGDEVYNKCEIAVLFIDEKEIPE